jgi:TRAP-type transport system periplasmic protein
MRKLCIAVAAAAALGLPLAAGAAEPMQIKFASPSPPVGPVYGGLSGFAADLNKEAAGAIDVKMFAGPSLANFGNVYDRTINGVADIAWGIIGPISSQFPKTNVVTLPFETDSGQVAAMALWHLYESGMIASEFTRVRPLGFVVFANVSLHAHKPITTMADLAGLKVSAEGRVLSRSLQNLGATPITMGVTQIYQSLQRGLIDATAIAWPAIISFKLDDVTTYHLDVSLGNDDGFIFMNKDVYARLPARGRAAIDKLSGAALVKRMENAVDAVTRAAHAHTASMKGKTITRLAPDEAARWKAKVAPSVDEWVKSTPDGAKVLAAFRAEVAKLSTM